MTKLIDLDLLFGTWTATSTSYSSQKQLYTNGSGDRLVKIEYESRSSDKAPNLGITLNGTYVTGLWYESGHDNLVKYKGDVLVSRYTRKKISVYQTQNELTITDYQTSNR